MATWSPSQGRGPGRRKEATPAAATAAQLGTAEPGHEISPGTATWSPNHDPAGVLSDDTATQ
eukprot:4441945-Alexandrium_andersonii.AAC.1